MKKQPQQEAGFTLIEVMLAIAITATVMMTVGTTFRVLLEARPPAGIWGGLLSLPELPAGFEASEWAAQRFACKAIAVSPAPARCVPLGTLVHAFSHFRLRISPLLMEVEPGLATMEPGLSWLALDSLANAALPAPVRRILEALHASGSKPLDSRKR